MSEVNFNKCRICGKEIFNIEEKQIICAECIPVATNESTTVYFNNILLDHMISMLKDSGIESLSSKELFDFYTNIIGCCSYFSELIMGNEPREILGRSIECTDEFIERMKINCEKNIN